VPIARLAEPADLPSLLALFAVSEVSPLLSPANVPKASGARRSGSTEFTSLCRTTARASRRRACSSPRPPSPTQCGITCCGNPSPVYYTGFDVGATYGPLGFNDVVCDQELPIHCCD
jgi:hypothetical protein